MRFADQEPYIWLMTTPSAVAFSTTVHGVTNAPLPDGAPSQPLARGVHRFTHTWLSG